MASNISYSHNIFIEEEMTLKPDERDNLLLRLDERSVNTYHLLEKLERHQEEQNDHIFENMKRSGRNAVYIKVICGVGGTSIITFLGWLAKIQGLW